jgi:hypothetical protein
VLSILLPNDHVFWLHDLSRHNLHEWHGPDRRDVYDLRRVTEARLSRQREKETQRPLLSAD